MTLEPIPPRRPLIWPEIIEQIAQAAPDPSRLYLVGGVVRDALRGQSIHDVDLATPDDGLRIARQLANKLNGAYYPVDAERQTGRAILPTPDGDFVIDVASFRADDLLGDLQGRDFTINAIAVRLDQLEMLIDPLGGQADLFDHKRLRQCSSDSIKHDGIRALRAIRMALQFNLMLAPETKAAAKAASLVDEAGNLSQPERVRDEFFKILRLPRQSAALRLMHALGLLSQIVPTPLPQPALLENTFSRIDHLTNLHTIIGQRNDNTAADLLLGVAVMVLDRFRRQLQEHLSQTPSEGRTNAQIVFLAALNMDATADQWTSRLRLSNQERRLLQQVLAAMHYPFPPPAWVQDRDRAIYRYYKVAGEGGVDAMLIHLANYLDQHGFEISAEAWGLLLDEVASPLLDAFFRRYQTVIAPPPLLTGDDLMAQLDMPPGPQMGKLLAAMIEEQAAGVIKTKKEALRFAKRFLSTIS